MPTLEERAEDVGRRVEEFVPIRICAGHGPVHREQVASIALEQMQGAVTAERERWFPLLVKIATGYHVPHEEPWGNCPDELCRQAYLIGGTLQ